jgi:hypothetical protein
MLDMFQVYADEDRNMKVNETRKGSVQKVRPGLFFKKL